MNEQELQGMKQELALFQINAMKRFDELDKVIGEFQSAHTGLERLGSLEDRVKVLEEARQKQISLNSTFIQKVTSVTNSPAVKVKKLWPWSWK